MLSSMPIQLYTIAAITPEWAESIHAAIELTLLITLIALNIIWWRKATRSVDTETSESASAHPAQPVPEYGEGLANGFGPTLAHLATLCQEFANTIEEVRHYSGVRERQIQNWQQFSVDIIRRMAPVLDNLALYLDSEDSEEHELAHAIHGRLLTELKTVGVQVIIPNTGDPFDAARHLLTSETTGSPPYQVAKVLAPGYLVKPPIRDANEVIIRPAEIIGESMTIAEPDPVAELAASTEEELPADAAVAMDGIQTDAEADSTTLAALSGIYPVSPDDPRAVETAEKAERMRKGEPVFDDDFLVTPLLMEDSEVDEVSEPAVDDLPDSPEVIEEPADAWEDDNDGERPVWVVDIDDRNSK